MGITLNEGDAHAWEGEGTETNPYIIKTALDLEMLAKRSQNNAYANTYFKQTADIALPPNFIGIGNTGFTKEFCGKYDGGGYTIKTYKPV